MYKQTHTIEISSELLVVKADKGTDGRRLTLTAEASSKQMAITNMQNFLDGLKAKLDQEKV
jgi:hypothetical protein